MALSSGDARGHRFSLLHRPEVPPVGAIVYIHPFAEEMNKARRMAALQARMLADRGWYVLQTDLLGCGDSAGDFGDASWEEWVSDVVRAADWLRGETGLAPALWGLRAGCLLAAAAAQRVAWTPRLLFWQPVISGRQHLQQFLRLKVAGEMLSGGQEARSGSGKLRDELLGGQSIEVAGYRLSPELAQGLDAARLLPPPVPGRLIWLELTSGEPGGLSPAAVNAISPWLEAGWQVSSAVVSGPAFWQTQEVEVAPLLLQESASRLLEGMA
ncbi:MAG: hydrolase 2, exosortase A system-associated [Rhodocyclaceae bacterium]|nr:hydrolase 2, exosortase A system-associated [Rhodocyclaceae bacterium]